MDLIPMESLQLTFPLPISEFSVQAEWVSSWLKSNETLKYHRTNNSGSMCTWRYPTFYQSVTLTKKSDFIYGKLLISYSILLNLDQNQDTLEYNCILYPFQPILLLFLVTPCLVFAAQPCMELNEIKKNVSLKLCLFCLWVRTD